MKLEFIDVRRAYLQAGARRDVYVELPEEDYEEGMCGKLVKSMYGARDAAQNWEEEYSNFMEELGFQRGIGSLCVFIFSLGTSRWLFVVMISLCQAMRNNLIVSGLSFGIG